jgi:hypothetical protein
MTNLTKDGWPIGDVFWLTWFLCLPGVLSISLYIPRLMLDFRYTSRFPDWWIFALLSDLGAVSIWVMVFVGIYVTPVAFVLLLVLLSSKYVPAKRKISASIAVLSSIATLLWLFRYWNHF